MSQIISPQPLPAPTPFEPPNFRLDVLRPSRMFYDNIPDALNRDPSNAYLQVWKYARYRSGPHVKRIPPSRSLTVTVLADPHTDVDIGTGLPDVVDSVSLTVGDTALLVAQTTAAENGLYVVTSIGGGLASIDAIPFSVECAVLVASGSNYIGAIYIGENDNAGGFTFTESGSSGKTVLPNHSGKRFIHWGDLPAAQGYVDHKEFSTVFGWPHPTGRKRVFYFCYFLVVPGASGSGYAGQRARAQTDRDGVKWVIV